MYCLWNGEYGEHDIAGMYSTKSSSEKNIERMGLEYEKWRGVVVGDFTCEKVEYDWGRRDQRWTCRCNLCGKVIYQYHAGDWRRGKGRKTTCDCRKEQSEREKREKIEQKKLEAQAAIDSVLGKTYGAWTVIEYNGGCGCTVRCSECGKQKRVRTRKGFSDLTSGMATPCNHQKPMDFTNDEWIGKRNGHLTVVGRVGNDFAAKCDCGNEVIVKPTFLFKYKSRRDCGASDCPYSTPLERRARERRENGLKFESDFEKVLRSKGYNAEKTQNQSDYGVDIVIYNDDGSKIAVQCKKQTAPAGVNAVQEVYAGGRYYDCDKFAVVCEKGFSTPAINMAKKLGIYLCDGEFDFPQDMDRYADNLLPTRKVSSTENNKYQSKSKRKKYCIRGYTGTISEVCRHYGVLDATVRYRINNRGMTLEEAIFA